MRWWPFGGNSSADKQPPAVLDEPADPEPLHLVRPKAEWQRLAPMQTVAEADPRVMPDASFRSALPSTWRVPASLAPLGHDVSMSAPAGLLPSLLAPVEGYADAPEMRWPSVVVPTPSLDPFAAPSSASRVDTPVTMQELPRSMPAGLTQVEVVPPARRGDGAGPAVAIDTLAVEHDSLNDEDDTRPAPALEHMPTLAEPDRRRPLIGDAPLVPRPADQALGRDEAAGSSEPAQKPDRPDPATVPRPSRSVLRSPDLASTSGPPAASRAAGVVADPRPPTSARPPGDRSDLERLSSPVPPAAESSEREESRPTERPEAATEARSTVLGALADEFLDRVVSPTFEAASQPDTLSVAGDVAVPGDVEDARPPAPSAGDPVDRIVTRTVQRVSEPLTRILRPTVGERLMTHDFRLRSANTDEPDLPRQTGSFPAPVDDQWPARPEAYADGSPEPTPRPSLDVPGLPAGIAWTAADQGPGAEGESFVWDARSAMRFPDQGQDHVDSGGPSSATPDMTDEPAAGSTVVPALDGFSIRPPRRRRALQVGIPTPRPERAPTERVAARRPAMSPPEFAQDHGAEDESGGQSQPSETPSDDRAQAGTGTIAAPTPAQDADAMADELYDRIRGRLRQELLIDRERNLLLTDLR